MNQGSNANKLFVDESSLLLLHFASRISRKILAAKKKVGKIGLETQVFQTSSSAKLI